MSKQASIASFFGGNGNSSVKKKGKEAAGTIKRKAAAAAVVDAEPKAQDSESDPAIEGDATAEDAARVAKKLKVRTPLACSIPLPLFARSQGAPWLSLRKSQSGSDVMDSFFTLPLPLFLLLFRSVLGQSPSLKTAAGPKGNLYRSHLSVLCLMRSMQLVADWRCRC